MEVINPHLKQQLDIIWRPHPALPSANCEFKHHEWKSGQTVRQILIASGIDQKQPIVISVDDRLLTVSEWDSVVPENCQIINVKAEVAGGGGGGSNTWQIVAMIAVVAIAIAAPYAAGGMFTATGLTFGAAGGLTMAGSLLTAGIMIAGSLLVNSVFAAQVPSMDMNSMGGTSDTSSTYSLSGGANRMRPYEAMPVLMGRHKFVPDMAIRPFNEYNGDDQYLYQAFHLGLSAATFSDWKIGDNAIENYSDVDWSYIDSMGRLADFPGNVDTTSGGELTYADGWMTRTTSENTYRIGIDIEGALFYANDDGSLGNTSVDLTIEYRPVGSGTWLAPTKLEAQGSSGFTNGNYVTYTENTYPNSYWDEDGNYHDGAVVVVTKTKWVAGSGNEIRITGKSQTPRRATLFFTPASSGQFEVRVKRLTADSTSTRRQNKTYWSALKSYQVDNGDYENQYRIGIKIKASEQLNGSIQQMSAIGTSKANYWNGSAWVLAETSNPAHWYMDFARGRKNAAGKVVYGVGLADSQIDVANLHAWATFCSTENLTFNAVLDGSQTAADVLSVISRCGFASPSWASGKLGVVWDARNAAPVAAFGMSNIIKNSFEVRYITEQLADEIVLRYINPDKDWIQDEVRVVVNGVTNPIRSTTVDILGCTNTTMAGKFANYLAAQQYYRRRRITWDCDFEGFVCQRGDVVLLSHDLTQWGYSGRIVSVDGNTITLDRKVPRNGSTEYVMLKEPDGTMTTYSATAETGDDDTLTLTTTPAFQDGYLPMDHLWFFSPLATPGKKVKIISVQPISESRIQIVATDEDPEFYTAWDGTWIEPAASTLLPAPQVPIIENLQISERLAVVGTGEVVTRCTITWQQKSSQVERVEVRYKLDDEQWRNTVAYGVTNAEVDFDGAGTVYAEAMPISGFNIGAKITGSQVVYGKTLPPADVTGFTSEVIGARLLLSWDKNPELDLAGYEVRLSDSNWGEDGFEFKGAASQCYVTPPEVGSSETWYIKAYDTSGNYSTSAVSVSFTPSAVTNISGFTYSFYDTSATSATVTLDWTDVAPQFGLDYYEITYGSVVKTGRASFVTVPADWVGDRTFVIKTVDFNGNKSTGYSSAITKSLPNASASGSSRVDNGALSLDWADAITSTLPVWGYEVRKDTNFGTSGFVFKGAASSCTVDVPSLTVGSNTFYVKTIDTDNNYSSSYLTLNHQYYPVYNTTSVTHVFADTSLTNASITLDWADVVPQYGLAYYEVTDGVVTRNVNASTITLPANWVGNRDFTIKTVDVNGFKSSGFTVSIEKLLPNSPSGLRTSVIDNTVMLYWTLPAKTTLPISHTLIKKGDTWETATEIGAKAGAFTTINELQAGNFTYWLAVVDTDGNESVAVSISANVAEPPDFIFNGSFVSTFSGTLSNAKLSNGYPVMPVNLTETWSDHFSTRSWADPQAQVTAGYPIYIQPGYLSGYYQETFDFGTLLGSSKVTVSYSGITVGGSPTVTCKIETSDDNATWSSFDGVTEIFALNFQYVRITITATGDDKAIYQLESLSVRCDSKQKTDSGMTSCLSTDANGTIANFNRDLIDVTSITLTASSTTPVTAVYDFQDAVLTGTYSVSSNVLTVNATGHGLIAGQKVRCNFSSGTASPTTVTIATAATNSFTASLTTGNTSGNLSIYPESMRIYLFNSSGTRVSGTASWSVRGY